MHTTGSHVARTCDWAKRATAGVIWVAVGDNHSIVLTNELPNIAPAHPVDGSPQRIQMFSQTMPA